MRYLRLILLPFSLIYFIIISLRKILYKLNILKSHEIQALVISVGNNTTGGTGKTPLCIFLIDLFLSLDKKVCLISRGYKRSSKGLVVGFDGDNPDVIDNTGDELMMIINRFSSFTGRFFVLADNNRVRAANYAVRKFKPDIIILDDAFQHLSIKRDIDILIRDCDSDDYTNRLLLPAGNLREPSSSYRRADIIINNFKFSDLNVASGINNITVDARYISRGIFDKDNVQISDINNENAIVFSGLAKNKSFFQYIRNKQKFKITSQIGFSDHHNYSLNDIDNLISCNVENSIYITTEKDFVKLRKYTEFFNNFEVYYLKIDLITDKNRILNIIKSKSNL